MLMNHVKQPNPSSTSCLESLLTYTPPHTPLQDALTDLTAHSECIDVEEFRSGRAHKGILSAAKYILQIINTRNLLEKAFTREPVSHSLLIDDDIILYKLNTINK